MVSVFGDILLMLSILNVFSLFLILFRTDSHLILKDFKRMFATKAVLYIVLNLMAAFFFLLPFSIPFTIMHIMDKENDDN
jgi:hypothetical protein